MNEPRILRTVEYAEYEIARSVDARSAEYFTNLNKSTMKIIEKIDESEAKHWRQQLFKFECLPCRGYNFKCI